MAKIHRDISLQKTIQMSNKLMERCLTPLNIRGNKIKTMMRYYCMPVRMTLKKCDTVCWER